MLTYPIFYRKHGIRRLGDLDTPPLGRTNELVLPKDSIVHYLSQDDVALGPEPEGALFKYYDGRVLVEHVQELDAPLGGPRPNRSTPANALYRDYHKRFRTMRPLHNFEKSLRDPRTLVVENYAHLNHLFIYMRSLYSNYYKWNNILKTVALNIEKRCQGNDRQHYIPADLPRRLPSVAMLKKASEGYKGMNKGLLEIFSRPQYMLILELWKFFGVKRQDSVFAQITPEHLRRVNFVWTESGSWFALNLGHVIDIAADQDLGDEEGSTNLQRRFLRLLITLFECRTSGVPTTDAQDKEADENTDGLTEPDRPEDGNPKIDEKTLDADLDHLDKLNEQMEADAQESEDEIAESADPIENILARATEMVENGTLSPAQHRRIVSLTEKSKNLPNPYGKGTLDEYREVKQEDLELDADDIKIPKVQGVTDESMLESTLLAFDSQYLKNVMSKDVANMAMAMQNAGIVVTEYDVEEVEDAANHYQTVTMKLNPIDGEPSTIRFRIPVVDESGVFVSNNVKYRLRKQRADKPIRKVSPTSVALTSYYAKAFVDRSEKSVVNYQKWLNRQIVNMGLDAEDNTITDLKHTKTFVSNVPLPRLYTILAMQFREFTIDKKYRFYVDYTRRKDEFGEELVASVEKDGFVFMGMAGKKPLVMDDNSAIYVVNGKEFEELGRIEELLGLNAGKAPVEIAEFRLFTKNVPVGIVLGHAYGLSRLMRTLGVKPRRVPVGTRFTVEDDEYAVRFADETLIFNKENQKAQLILAGLNRYHRSVRKYTVDAFDDPEVYANLMEDNGIRVGFIRELELTMQMFVDPITRGLLEEMGEPTSLDKLLIRSCELLLTDQHPDETDMNAMRIRGYERMAGAVYTELAKSIRRYRSMGVGGTPKVELNPEAVWQVINQDPSISQIEESNPIMNLKEKELVTYMGTGGRSSQSMVKRTRSFHESDMGVISEATVDSSAVGVNAYLSANPQFSNLRGLTNAYDPENTGNSSMISTSALLAPAADVDDPKRVNFISIQNSHVVAANGYRANPLRTGYERVVPHRVDDLFAYTAKQDGEVVKKDKRHVTVRYKDGTEVKVELGTRYGVVTGTTVPHELVCDLEVGAKFKEGDSLVFNKGFFERDPLLPNQVLMRTGVLAKVAIMERSHTFEDASVISERLAKELTTQLTNVRNITVRFDQAIRNLVKPGDDVDTESILCTIEEAVTANNDAFDDESLDALKLMSANTPKAKYAGKVDRVEVFYHGDKEDMSDSLREIAEASDKDRVARLKALGKTPTTGSIDGSVRIDKDPLDLDSMIVRVYITGDIGAGIGDKGVLANQMKTVFSHVMSGTNKTETGVDLDMLFAYMSISNRIVLSPEVMGTTISLLRVMSKRVAEKYFSKRGNKS